MIKKVDLIPSHIDVHFGYENPLSKALVTDALSTYIEIGTSSSKPVFPCVRSARCAVLLIDYVACADVLFAKTTSNLIHFPMDFLHLRLLQLCQD